MRERGSFESIKGADIDGLGLYHLVSECVRYNKDYSKYASSKLGVAMESITSIIGEC